MGRRWVGWGSLVAGALAVGFVAWVPDYRLHAEETAARREGIWTETSDVRRGLNERLPAGENAAPGFRAAIAANRAATAAPKKLVRSARLIEGMATATQVADWRADLLLRRGLLARWQAASVPPRLDYGRQWEKGMALLIPEYSQVKSGAHLLIAAAHLGVEPRKNLLAAARIANLSGQEPLLIAQSMKADIGALALTEARRQGLGREVEAALGPPIDFRWALACEPLGVIDMMRRIGSPEADRWLGTPLNNGALERIKHTGPWKANATRAMIHRYRALWRELPKDPTDYEGAIRVMDRHMPGIDAALGDFSEVAAKIMGGSQADVLRSFAKFEAERRAARKGP